MGLVDTIEASILALAIFACCYYVVARKRRKQWPVTEALIQKGAIGQLDLAEAGVKPAVFMGYSFKVNGVRYAHCFVLFGNEVPVHDLNRRLPGTPLQVRYNPSDPNTSFLVNYSDARFGGFVASQNPIFLEKAPTFDLRDALDE